MGFAPSLLAIEVGCLITGNGLKMEPVCLVRAEDLPMDPLSCKKRRQQRVEVLRRKRQRTGSFSDTSSVVSSDDSRISQPCYLTKDDMRRKKNRESAERSRLRKLALIDALAVQVRELTARLKDLKEENFHLRSLASGARLPENSAKASGKMNQLVTLHSYQFGHERSDTDSDLSTLSSSSSSSPQRPSSPASFSFESSAGMCTNNCSVDKYTASSALVPSFPSSSGPHAHSLPDYRALKNGSTHTDTETTFMSTAGDCDFDFDALCDLDFGDFMTDVHGLF